MRAAAILLAAGRGERLGHALPKAFVPLAGRSLLARSAEALRSSPGVEAVQPVLPAGAGLPEDARGLGLLPPVAGGARRQDSVLAGLRALPEGFEWVAVHDAARPRVRPEAVAQVLEAARRHGAALLAVPVADTLKRVHEGRVVETAPREGLWAAQTPQAFRTELLREALEKALAEGRSGTDCASLVEALGAPVWVVEGDPDNRKITGPEDLAEAERELASVEAAPAGAKR